jgi:hypothetical protein
MVATQVFDEVEVDSSALRLIKEPSFTHKRIVRAGHSFSGSNDEVSFKIGDGDPIATEESGRNCK